jgi:hypothetical protein
MKWQRIFLGRVHFGLGADLTPRPPSRVGKGENCSPPCAGKGLGVGSAPKLKYTLLGTLFGTLFEAIARRFPCTLEAESLKTWQEMAKGTSWRR